MEKYIVSNNCYRFLAKAKVIVFFIKQESPADAVEPARRKSMQKLLQFDVFRFISPNSISPNFKV